MIALAHTWQGLGVQATELASPALKPNAIAQTTYVGSQVCADCHVAEYRDWQQSHHWHAMQPATEKTVLGDFNNAEFTYNGITSRFYRRDNKYFVKTDNANGALQEFEIAYTFGIEPLQQYLDPALKAVQNLGRRKYRRSCAYPIRTSYQCAKYQA